MKTWQQLDKERQEIRRAEPRVALIRARALRLPEAECLALQVRAAEDRIHAIYEEQRALRRGESR